MDDDGDYRDYAFNYEPRPRPLTTLEDLFVADQKATAKSMVARNKYKATIKNYEATSNKRIITRSKAAKLEKLISKHRSNYRATLRNRLAKAQSLYNQATADNDDIYQRLTVKNMSDTDDTLQGLDKAGLRRKRNKSRNKVYSAHKKSKQRRVKSTRRCHKKQPDIIATNTKNNKFIYLF